MYEGNLEELKKQCSNSKIFYHKININSPILPFITDSRNQTHFDNGFENIMGEFARISSDKSLNKDFSITNISNDLLLDNIQIEENIGDYLKIIIDEYLLNDNNFKILHPFLFLYIEKTQGARSNNETEIARFIRDVFFKDIENFNDLFNNEEICNVAVKLILNNIQELPEKITYPKYISCLSFVVDIFREDLEFIKENMGFLLNNIYEIFAFYYFYYCSQLILKLNQPFDKVDLNNPSIIYYLLDWEKASKSRKSINEGRNILKEANKSLFVNMNLLEHINILAGTHGFFICQINDLIKESKNEKEFLAILREWIKYYDNVHSVGKYIDYDNFEDLISLLKNELQSAIKNQQKTSFTFNLNNIGKKYFLKRRGQYGYALNITKDFLYLITALCVKEDKIKLNDLFKEYERRGLFFDRYSKEEIVNLLNTWNLIDKKSDSGDAQYVKSIL
ncbi:DNA phosphorothioation-dependent restriction protein DptG [uncultured Methanobrevibacter sp.]|uniref:DNA phosphorothioation-dependent restriction protein DptG n=1 Tax=uncultured Methanobrevibacter sp. TaxID=253161 RepID=UPI0026313084|nr:DNA phosphorothioation-dependent restriction protein DptG [uncultured Methanobrevibacter sp.]